MRFLIKFNEYSVHFFAAFKILKKGSDHFTREVRFFQHIDFCSFIEYSARFFYCYFFKKIGVNTLF